MARLLGLAGVAVGQQFSVIEPVTTIGREADNVVVLASSAVSRHHARISLNEQGFWIEDLGSANGTKLNHAPISTACLLRNGDHIALGDVSLLFELPDPAPGPRRVEVGSQERFGGAVPQAPSMPTAGCNPLGPFQQDLEGGLSEIMRRLPQILMILIGLILLLVLFRGIGALIGLGQQMTSGNSQPSQNPPSSPPPPATPPPSSGGGTAKITVLSTRVIVVRASDGSAKPTLLVKWRNDSPDPVQELKGDVTCKRSDGTMEKISNIRLYQGAPVAPGAIHEDMGQSDGTQIDTDQDPSPSVVPTEVKG